MCRNCNYSVMLEAIGLSATNNRLRVLEIIGTSSCPLTAQDVYSIFCRTEPINRVTIYRILELLVKKGLLDRLSGGRAAYYGMAPNEHHTAHPHFYCTMCGRLDCLAAESLDVNPEPLQRNFSGQIDRIEVRIDGICKHCLKQQTGLNQASERP